jgi:O-antigen ligase
MRADDVTAGSRLLIWRGAARMIADNPALGVGIGNFFARYPQYMLPEGWREPLLYHAHNAALDFWSMLGIGGLATLIWLEVAFWRTVVRLRRPKLSPDMRALVIGLAAGMAYALAHGLVDTLYFLPDLALAFMLALGMVGTLDLAPGRAADAP